MKQFICTIYYLMLMVSALCLSSCGGNDANDSGGGSPTPSGITITLRSQTISESAEVDAATTTVLTLNYNNTVKVTGTGITLNGANVTAKSNPVTAMSVDVPLALEDGTEYTLNVSKGAIVATADPSVSAPELTIHFKTRAKGQPVNPDIPTTPVTASTEEARQLYSFLLEQYGVKTISSVMANVNWNNECAEKVYQLTGKYPAMNCYDFIHILYSPANWIDYSTIKPVQDWVNAGGLVQLMWHFNVPKYEGSTDATCTPSETTFKASNALVSGTWENKWFYEQMDKVVATLLKLQDAGIAATWRPFHEAAGNATAKQQASWTKSWFWWGYDGAETYKKLWVAMFDYFKQKGVNNLIWVWTTQNYNGNSANYNQDTAWYPGDEYVDIVARDLYGYTGAQHQQEFEEIQQRYPNKMVALGECGWDGNNSKESATPSEFWKAGALWSHFMVWYQGNNGTTTGTMCSDAWWKAAMSAESVITRDQLPK